MKPGWAFILACAMGVQAHADTLHVAAAGASKHALETLAPAFERATGHHLQLSFDTVGAQRDRVLRGEAVDVVVVSNAALQQLSQAGRLAGSPLAIGQVQVGIAVPRSGPPPDVSTAGALKATLLAAPSIAYADPARGATAGTHFAKVLDALALRDLLQSRLAVLPFGVDVVQAVAEGRFAIGISQSSEIVQHAGVRYAGPLPAPYAQATGYSAARTASASPAAGQLIEFLGSPAARAAFAESGFAAP